MERNHMFTDKIRGVVQEQRLQDTFATSFHPTELQPWLEGDHALRTRPTGWGIKHIGGGISRATSQYGCHGLTLFKTLSDRGHWIETHDFIDYADRAPVVIKAWAQHKKQQVRTVTWMFADSLVCYLWYIYIEARTQAARYAAASGSASRDGDDSVEEKRG